MLPYNPEYKAEYIKQLAPRTKLALLRSKIVRDGGEELYQIKNIAGQWELRHLAYMPKNKRYELQLNGSHVGYYPSIIQASRAILSEAYEGIFR